MAPLSGPAIAGSGYIASALMSALSLPLVFDALLLLDLQNAHCTGTGTWRLISQTLICQICVLCSCIPTCFGRGKRLLKFRDFSSDAQKVPDFSEFDVFHFSALLFICTRCWMAQALALSQTLICQLCVLCSCVLCCAIGRVKCMLKSLDFPES